jgi:hypothetical protein
LPAVGGKGCTLPQNLRTAEGSEGSQREQT